MSGAEAVIDLAAYRQNLDTVTSRIAPAALMAVVKADGYGHGLVPVAQAAVAQGVGWLGTLDVATGLVLRQAGIGSDVRIFAWLLRADEDYRAAIDGDIDLGVSNLRQLRGIAASGARRPATVHLKIDTGLHRYGATTEEWPGLIREAVALQGAGVVTLHAAWTHLAEASDDEDSAAIGRFHSALAVADGLGARFALRHLAASAAGFARPDARLDLVRVGAFGYGISPGGGIAPADLGLVPVMTLVAPVVDVLARNGVRLAVVPIGLADGIPADAAGRISVAVDGIRRSVVSVGLNQLELDAADGEVRPGAEAVLFGTGERGEATLQEWADLLGTIGEEIVVRLAPRIPRRYVGN